MVAARPPIIFPHRHLLGIEPLSAQDIVQILDVAEEAVEVSRQADKKRNILRGRTQINLFFENSTRTQASFELAGKRLGADVMNMSVATSSVDGSMYWIPGGFPMKDSGVNYRMISGIL